MLKINNKLILLLLSFLSLILLNSCSYENTTIDLGSDFDSTWTFSNSTDYEFNENLVEVVNGKAQLKVLDLEHSGDDFNSGNHVGSQVSGSNVTLLEKPTPLETHLNTILSDDSANLIGYYRLEGNYIDSSSLGNNGTIKGNAVLSNDSKVGSQSILLDGDGDNIEVSDSISIKQQQIKTYGFWLKKNGDDLTGSGYSHPFRKGSVWNGDTVRFRVIDGNPASVRCLLSQPMGAGEVSAEKNNVILEGVWYHIACVIDSDNNFRLYINGVEEDSIPFTELPNNSSDSLYIGSSGFGSHSFNGNIDEVFIYNQPLSASKIHSVYTAQVLNFTELSSAWTPKWDNIVGYWKMDGNWQDSSGNGLHGIPGNNNGVNDNLPQHITSGKIGSGSGRFDDETAYQYVEIPNGPLVEDIQESSFSLQLWYKPEELPNNTVQRNLIHSLFMKQGFHLGLSYTSGGRFDFYWWDTSNIERGARSTAVYEVGKYHHVVAVANYETEELILYVNGEVANRSDISGYTVREQGTQLWRIGAGAKTIADSTSGWFADGDIDEVSLWNTPLTSSDIQQIYQRQKQKYSASYESEVIDLGGTTVIWPDLSWSTSLPFGKELVGDFDNDGASDIESLSSYFSLNGDFSNGLIGYWPLNESIYNSVSGHDFQDHSGLNQHGNETGGVIVSELGQFNKSVSFDGLDDRITVVRTSALDINSSDFSISAWVNTTAPGFMILTSKGPSCSGDVNSCYRIQINSDSTFGSYIEAGDADTFASISNGNKLINDGLWHHVVAVFDRDGNMSTYVDGLYETSIDISGENSSLNNSSDLLLGDRTTSISTFNGQLEEVAIWSRTLTATEIQQLYRRGANRVKLQVKSCVDSSCNCKSYGAGGSETDCDGDTILNTADTDDIHKSEFIGPGGDGTTYYSELYNRTSTEVTFNCALNITDSDAGVCAPDEITLTAGPKPTGPEFLNIDYTQFIKPPANRYAQYRVYMEADDNTACGGEPCLPELTSVSLNPTSATKYSSEYIKVKPKSPITFTKLLSAQIDAEPCATFSLSRSNTEYYFDGSNWVPATADAHRNTVSEVESNITKFASDHGMGELEVNAYLASDASQSTQCSVNSIDVKYE